LVALEASKHFHIARIIVQTHGLSRNEEIFNIKMEILIIFVSFDVQIKKEIELVHILALVQIFAEVDVKVALNFRVDAIEHLEVVVWEV